jgi:t-SNARE complex subunit (syntaxin)
VARQVQIVRPEATVEEIETVMKSDGGAQQLYKDQIQKGDVADPIKGAYQQVSQK